MTQNIIINDGITEPYFNQMQKEVLEVLTLLQKQTNESKVTYTTESTEISRFLDSILGEHSVRDGRKITISDERELPDLQKSLSKAKELATEQGNTVLQSDLFTIDSPAELTLLEQTIIISETAYFKETEKDTYLILDLEDTEIYPSEAIPFFYSFNPMILNNQQVLLCNTDEFLSAVEQKPIPGISEKLPVDVRPVQSLPFEPQRCDTCDKTYEFMNTHQTYCHEKSQSLSKIQKEVIKGLIVSEKGNFICTDDGWAFELNGVPKEFAEWVQNVLSVIDSSVTQKSEGYTLLTAPSNAFTGLVQLFNGEREVTYKSSKEFISVLFALKGEVYNKEVYFDLNEDNDKCAEMFEVFESFRVANGECVMSLSEFEVFVGDEIPGFEQKWQSNMVRFSSI